MTPDERKVSDALLLLMRAERLLAEVDKDLDQRYGTGRDIDMKLWRRTADALASTTHARRILS